MRLRCSGQRRLNETLLELSVARYNRTGMATIPKLMTPFQIDRGIVHHLAGRFPLFARGLAARIVTVPSRKRTRPATAAPGRDPEEALERRRVAAPVLTDDRAVGRSQHEPKGERRHDRIVQRTDYRNELRDEIDRRSEPDARHREDDLRAKGNTTVAQETSEESDQIRQEQRELAGEQSVSDDDEHHDDHDPHRDEDEKDVGPDG